MGPNGHSETEKTNLLLGLEHYFNDIKVANYSYTKSESDRL
ncbi:hypothetical protein ACN2CX_11115 [Aliarcobacter butzleri]